ncbi:unnamed protein product [Bursaphelenchus xylophilus]|nr:unnamed protein product [Bursaphelenchus xylophilus]CAG9100799.1 unnamed protein product [Bursaphelenchus xylophilus]
MKILLAFEILFCLVDSSNSVKCYSRENGEGKDEKGNALAPPGTGCFKRDGHERKDCPNRQRKTWIHPVFTMPLFTASL